ncbi:hypothetical protein EON82_07205 [bacterium]|nr:MAG: hypothetical protein EON82_07205 [bacterium]
MRTDLPLVLALAAKANAFFGGSDARMELLAGHPAFARIHELTFMRQTGASSDLVADASVPWFRRLKKEGVPVVRPILTGMRLDKGADSAWGLLTDSDRGLELWTPAMGVRFNGHSDLQPLRLTMTATRFDRWSVKPLPSLDGASDGLRTALEDAKLQLEQGAQSVAANAVGKFLSLHLMESPELSGELACLAPDIEMCCLPLFASAVRCLTLLETTGWLSASDETARAFAEPLWVATRTALESSVSAAHLRETAASA